MAKISQDETKVNADAYAKVKGAKNNGPTGKPATQK